eukprot:gene15533-22203_t
MKFYRRKAAKYARHLLHNDDELEVWGCIKSKLVKWLSHILNPFLPTDFEEQGDPAWTRSYNR